MPKLSFSKLVSLLTRHKYSITQLYCTKEGKNDEIRILECSTPIFKQRFLLNIPEKYNVKYTDEKGGYNLKYIYKDDDPPERQVDYIIGIKTETEEDIGTVTCNTLLIIGDNSTSFYLFDRSGHSEDETESNEQDDNVERLERDATMIMSNSLSINDDVDDIEIIDCPDDEGEVELVFKDEDGDAIDDVKSYIDLSEDLESLKSNIVDIQPETDESLTIKPPINIEESPSALGAIFIVISLSSFVKEVKSIEDKITAQYRTLGRIEKNNREKRLEKIHSLTDQFLKVSTERLVEYSAEEARLDTQLIRLSLILRQTSLLRKKVEENPGKFSTEIDKDSQKLINETEKAISDLNFEMIKLRENADTLLIDYEMNIRDLIEM